MCEKYRCDWKLNVPFFFSIVIVATIVGLTAESIMKSGNLVPDNMMLDLLVAELKAKGGILEPPGFEKQPSFILDGLPRTTAQAKALDSIVPINFVVHLQTPKSIILSRITSRWIHPRSGRVYNTKFNPPKTPGVDDETGEPLVQRADDGLETWKQRFLTFEKTSQPLLEVYKDKGVLWEVEGNSSDEISPKLFAEIDRRFG